MLSSNEQKPSTRRNQPGTIGYYRDLEHNGVTSQQPSCKHTAITARALVDAENVHPHGLVHRPEMVKRAPIHRRLQAD